MFAPISHPIRTRSGLISFALQHFRIASCAPSLVSSGVTGPRPVPTILPGTIFRRRVWQFYQRFFNWLWGTNQCRSRISPIWGGPRGNAI